MKAKDQLNFYNSIESMEMDSLKKIRELLLQKKLTNDNFDKLKMIDVAIESKQKSRPAIKCQEKIENN